MSVILTLMSVISKCHKKHLREKLSPEVLGDLTVIVLNKLNDKAKNKFVLIMF